MLLVSVSLVVLAASGGCATAQPEEETSHGVAVHPCTNNPLMRSVGIFGGRQPEIFLSGPDVRREPAPAANSLTRVLDVTKVDNLGDPNAEPVIDKCSSWLQSIDEDEVELTIQWHDRNCPASFDEEEPIDCGSRASFRFSRKDLGMEEILGSGGDPSSTARGQLVVDAYFTQEIQPTRRHSATGMPLPERGRVHLVVRVMRAPQAVDSGAAITVDAIREARSQC